MSPEETKAMRRKEARDCTNHIEKQECFFTACDFAKTIRKAVQNGVITWDELEITDEKIGQIVIEIQAREAVRFLRYLVKDDDLQSAKYYAKAIRKAVLDKAIIWEKLGTTDEKISKMVVEAQVREAKKYVGKMKTEYPPHIVAFVEGWIESVRKAVSDKLISWNGLRITETNFDKLATVFSGTTMNVGDVITLQQQV